MYDVDRTIAVKWANTVVLGLAMATLVPHGGVVAVKVADVPYDAPDQDAWRHGDVLGYAAYKAADDIRSHEGWGMGSYIYTNVDPSPHASRAFESPVTPGVRFHDLLTVSLNHAGTIDHVINDTGGPATPDFRGPSTVVSFP